MTYFIHPPIFAGERRTFRVQHDFEESADLSALPQNSVRFYSRRRDGEVHVDGGTAAFEDVTPADKPLKSVWSISYKLTAPEASQVGEYVGAFRVYFSGDDPDFIPEPPGIAYSIVFAP